MRPRKYVVAVSVSVLLLTAVVCSFSALPRISVLFESKQTLVGPDEAIYYMIIEGAPLEDISAELTAHPELVNGFAWHGEPLLTVAADEAREDVLLLLFEMGAEVDSYRRTGGCSPMLAAVADREIEIVKILLDHGASPFQNESFIPVSPYDVALDTDCEEIVRLMLEHSDERRLGEDEELDTPAGLHNTRQ